MATKSVVLITSGPDGGAPAALELAARMRQQGQDVDVCLLQDGVLCALRDNETQAGVALGGALDAGVALYYVADDLAARGFSEEGIRSEGHPLEYGDLAQMLLADGSVTLGAF